jgi:Holliday junction resolvase RusA-like endonuclease
VTEIVHFRLAGVPVPQGSKKLIPARFSKARKLIPARLIDDNAPKLKPWRRDLKKAAERAKPFGMVPEPGPVRVVCLFALPKPASAPKRRRTWPIGKGRGDVDKLARAVLDALTDAEVVRDDSQVIDLHASKDYPGVLVEQMTPGVLVRVYRIEHAPPIPAGETKFQEGLPL